MIKNTIINLSALIKNSDDSKCIFYHDIHSDNRFTDMSTSVDLFEKHISIIRELGFEIVHEITKEKIRFLFLLMMDLKVCMRILK